MKHVTSVFQCYRDSARHLSNTCYRPKYEGDWDTRENFDEISVLLFKHLVLNELQISHTLCDWLGQPAEIFKLQPSTERIPVMINRDGTSGYWDHPKTELDQNEAEIAFIDYFDWDEMDTIDFRYIRGKILKSRSGDLDGHDILVETIYVNIYHDKNAEQASAHQSTTR